MQTPNIFDNIVKNEDTLTYLLVNMLRMKKFREAFLEVVFKKTENDLKEITVDLNKIKIDYNDITAQHNTVENGRPDIVIENDDVSYFIEVKVSKSTGLTDNQPVGYLQELLQKNQKNKGLILLAPRGYKHLKVYTEGLKNKNRLFTNEIVWKSIINQIEIDELELWNPIISEFHKLLKHWFLAPPIILNLKNIETMYTSDTPTAISKIVKIVDEVVKELNKGFDGIYKKKHITHEYGCYIPIANLKDTPLFFGEWFPYWKKSGNPFCICILTEEILVKNAFVNICNKMHFPEPELFDNWHVTYLPKNEIGANDIKLVEKITDKINEMVSEMNKVIL